MASGTGTTPVITGGGVLRLHLSSTSADYFEFDPPGTNQTPVTQSITTSKCVVPVDQKNSLLVISPTPSSGGVGLFGDGIGVKVNGEGTGQPCGRVDGATQSLTLTLGGQLAGKSFSVAALDIE